MPLVEWRRMIEAEADRLGLDLNSYLACVFPFSAIAAELLRQFIEELKKD